MKPKITLLTSNFDEHLENYISILQEFEPTIKNDSDIDFAIMAPKTTYPNKYIVSTLYIIEMYDELVGYAVLHLNDGVPEFMNESKFYVLSIFLIEEYRQKGIGSHVLREIISLVNKQNIPLYVHVKHYNTWMQKLCMDSQPYVNYTYYSDEDELGDYYDNGDKIYIFHTLKPIKCECGDDCDCAKHVWKLDDNET